MMPPMPSPAKVKGLELAIEFDVDSTGKVLDFKFEPTRDGGYNKRLREIFMNARFRPGVNSATGMPVRAKVVIQMVL
jgi:hypothetical protein